MFSLILSVVLLSAFARAQDATVSMHNELCGLRREVVALDSKDHKYYPFFVELHRCRGSADQVSPILRHCAAKQWTDITVQVFDLRSNSPGTLVVQNHTACSHNCTQSSTNCHPEFEVWSEEHCICACQYSKELPAHLAPKKGFRWNPSICRYECNRAPESCPRRMEWSEDVCGCTCRLDVVKECWRQKTAIDTNCNCISVKPVTERREGSPISVHLFVILVLGEGVVIVMLALAIAYWVRRARNASKDCAGQTGEGKGHIMTPHGSTKSVLGQEGFVEQQHVEPTPV